MKPNKPYVKLIGKPKQTITLEQAKKIKDLLDGKTEPENIAQETYILSVQDVFIPNEDSLSTEPIRAFIRHHIALEPSRLKDTAYRNRWIEDYKRENNK